VPANRSRRFTPSSDSTATQDATTLSCDMRAPAHAREPSATCVNDPAAGRWPASVHLVIKLESSDVTSRDSPGRNPVRLVGERCERTAGCPLLGSTIPDLTGPVLYQPKGPYPSETRLVCFGRSTLYKLQRNLRASVSRRSHTLCDVRARGGSRLHMTEGLAGGGRR
jgi:hypothetical protein